ncbi:MAG: T9SS type A sorting domain-containing protein [Bacteroidia bacterium]|nr:T9SS type A sorting domain-containing protein [Bacteroidia bacterium]
MQGKTWYDLSSSQYSTIQQIYLNNPETAIYARAVLAMVKGFEYERCPFDIIGNRNSILYSAENSSNILTESTFKVYPNPALNDLTIEVYLSDVDQSSAELRVYNMLGAEVERANVRDLSVLTLNVSEFNNGIYLVVLKNDRGLIEKKKVIITR